jgi:hypothetical protein
MSNVIPLPNPHAPACGQCGCRMRLAAFHPDPNGGRYIFEHFRCAACGVEAPYVRPVAAPDNAPVPAVSPFARRGERAHTAVAGAPEPSRFG